MAQGSGSRLTPFEQGQINDHADNGLGPTDIAELAHPEDGSKVSKEGVRQALLRLEEEPDWRGERLWQLPAYQLEATLGKEVVFPNGFGLDHGEKWRRWAYFMHFLEGGSLPVARLKHWGDNMAFSSDSLVIGTCASPVQLLSRSGRGMAVTTWEATHMNNRPRYSHLLYPIPEIRGCSECAGARPSFTSRAHRRRRCLLRRLP